MHLGWGLSFLSWTRCRFGWRSTTSVSSDLKPLLKNVVFVFCRNCSQIWECWCVTVTLQKDTVMSSLVPCGICVAWSTLGSELSAYCFLNDGTWMRSHHGVSGSKMQIFSVFQSPALLSLTQDEFLDTWSHEMKVCPAFQLHKNSFYTWPPASACSVLSLQRREARAFPWPLGFLCVMSGMPDVGINAGRFRRICEWLVIDWLAFRRFLSVSWPQVWGIPGLLCSELQWRSIEPGTQEVWVLDLPLSELTVRSVFLFLLSQTDFHGLLEI